MEILRVQPYSDILVSFVVPQNVEEETEIAITITDMADLSVTNTYTYQREAGDIIQYPLPSKYDADYRVVITADLEDTEIIFDDNFHVVRPYVDPNTLGSTATEIATATSNEELARAIIDSVIPQGFYFKKETFEMVGLGADYLPLWVNAKKILKIYENNILVFDVNAELNRTVYEITKDKTAIVEQYSDIINRTESAPNLLPTSASDLLDLQFGYRGFPRNFDYRVILEVGHTSVPSDIVRATKLLIEDISCGKLEYPKRYVSAYNTDQYKVQFDKRVFEGTGNLIVDKILSKYAKSITRLGVL
jgi:hypothetical protein